jgi:hypothetical protein
MVRFVLRLNSMSQRSIQITEVISNPAVIVFRKVRSSRRSRTSRIQYIPPSKRTRGSEAQIRFRTNIDNWQSEPPSSDAKERSRRKPGTAGRLHKSHSHLEQDPACSTLSEGVASSGMQVDVSKKIVGCVGSTEY